MAISLITSYQLKSSAQGTTAITTPSFTPSNGEIITITMETWDTTVTISATNTGSQTVTTRVTEQPGGFNSFCRIQTITVSGSPGAMTISATPSASARYSMTVERWSGAQLAATPVTNANTSTTGAAQSTITPSASGSRIVWVSADSQSVSPTTRAYAGSGTDDGIRDDSSGANGVGYHGYQTSTGTTSQTYGLTAPTGQKWVICAIEVQAAGGSSLTGDASLAATASFTASAGEAELGAASLAVTATFAAAAARQYVTAASLSITASFAAGTGEAELGAAALPVTATFTAAASRGQAVTASLAVTASFTDAVTAGPTSNASLAVTAGLTAAASLGAAGSATLPVTASFTAGAAEQDVAAASLPVTATLTAAASRGQGATAALPVTVSFAAGAGEAESGDTSLAVTASFSAGATTTTPGSAAASLPVTASFTAAASAAVLVAAVLPVTATFTASDSRGQPATASLAVTATFTAAALENYAANASLGVTASFTASAGEQESGTAALPVTVSFSATASTTAAGPKFADASLSVIASFVAAALTVSPVKGDWYQLVSILDQNRAFMQMDTSMPPQACPHDGEPLRVSLDGIRWCPFDSFVWPEGSRHMAIRRITGGDWGGIRGVVAATVADTREDDKRKWVACPNDGEPLSRSIDGFIFCRWDGWTPPGQPDPDRPSSS